MKYEPRTLLTLWINHHEDDGPLNFLCEIVRSKWGLLPIFSNYISHLESQFKEWVVKEYKAKNISTGIRYFIEAHRFKYIGEPDHGTPIFKMRIVETLGDGEDQEKFDWDKAIEKWMEEE